MSTSTTSTIAAADVGKLRELTGAPLMDCKRALQKVGGDIEAAIEEMRKSGQMKADKKADRQTAEGAIFMAVSSDNKKALMIEINSETDFVSRNDDFKNFGEQVAKRALAAAIEDVTKLSEALYKEGDTVTIEQMRQQLIAKIGENIQLRRATLVNASSVVGAYLHGARIGVLVELADGGDATLARDIAMHIAASMPQVVNPQDVPQSLLDKEKEIFIAQAQQSGKPADIIEKMVQGRLNKFIEEISLTGQPFVKQSDITVGQLLAQSKAKVVRFVRYAVGEGIEKQVTDFAAEVMSQMRK